MNSVFDSRVASSLAALLFIKVLPVRPALRFLASKDKAAYDK